MGEAAEGDRSGTIGDCASAGCGYTCCEFNRGNFIVLPPGELEGARASGAGLGHLEITPLPFGGHRAICTAGDTASCDGGYKPLDCQSYPFFPTVDAEGEVIIGLKGAKCPLAVREILPHRSWVKRRWNVLTQDTPAIVEWLKRVRLVGYRLIER